MNSLKKMLSRFRWSVFAAFLVIGAGCGMAGDSGLPGSSSLGPAGHLPGQTLTSINVSPDPLNFSYTITDIALPDAGFPLSFGAVGNYSDLSTEGIIGARVMAAGDAHTCAVSFMDTVKCWGNNLYGQLGDGTTTDSSVPVQVVAIRDPRTALFFKSRITSISAGFGHTCALFSWFQTVKCWGFNFNGQLGDGTTVDSSSPVPVSGISSAVSVSAGRSHTCSVLSDRTLRCWGLNASAQLGTGDHQDSLIPVSPVGITTAVGVAAGGSHTCALLSGGTVQCWGSNGNGQLGDGTFSDSFVPQTVPGITTAVGIAAGGSHTCVVLLGGTVQCWGNNASGQVGDGTFNNAPSPVTVSGISAVGVSAGNSHACALLTDNTLSCWGENASGQLGDGTFIPSSLPVTVSGISTAASVAAGGGHSCGILSDRSVQCWGSNLSGQLGDGTTIDSSTPGPVAGIPGVFWSSSDPLVASVNDFGVWAHKSGTAVITAQSGSVQGTATLNVDISMGGSIRPTIVRPPRPPRPTVVRPTRPTVR